MTSMTATTQVQKASFAGLNLIKPFLKTSIFPLAGIWLGSFALNQMAHEMMEQTRNAGPNFFAIGLMALTEVTVSFLLLLLIPKRLWELRHERPLPSLWAVSSKYSKDLAAELMRVTAGVVVGVVMFVVPGIARAIRWTFVPHIVLLDDQYEAGKRNALTYSAELTKGIGWWLFALWVLFTIIDLGLYNLEIFGESFLPGSWPTWPFAAAVSVISFAFMIYSHLLYFALYVIRLETTGEAK